MGKKMSIHLEWPLYVGQFGIPDGNKQPVRLAENKRLKVLLAGLL
jgi:hypothetical protein